MKILQIAGGGDRGGAKTHILGLCSRLKERCDLTLLSLRSGEFPQDSEAAGISTKTIFSRNPLKDYLDVIRYVRQEKPDVVHCHGAKANLAGVLCKLFCGSTIVTTVHSDYKLDYMLSFLRRNTVGRINAFCLRHFDYYITVSDSFRRMLISRGFYPSGMMTIYNGLDFSVRETAEDREAYLRSLGLDYQPGDIVIGIPARLDPVKDIPTLLQAFAKARQQEPRLKLVVAGEGGELEKLRTLADRLKLGSTVAFPGWLKDVPKLFACCDLDVLCSISESFPYSILEGIREGCAVITSDVGGVRKLIDHGENGYIFRSGDVDTFAGYILELARDPEKRAAFAEKLYAKASALYSLEAMADTQIGIYERILRLEHSQDKRDGVVICGAYGKGNTGDEAILEAILADMKTVDRDMPVTVMTRRPRETMLTHGVDAIYIFNLPAFWRKCRRSALFISGGGSLIQDVTSSRSLYFYLYAISAAKKRGCAVQMYGCGIGPVGRDWNRRLSAKVLNKYVDAVTLRDHLSAGTMSDMGIRVADTSLTADPAIGLHPAEARDAAEYFIRQGLDPDGRYICFALRNWKGFDLYAPYAEAAAYAWEKYQLTALFYPIEQPADVHCAKKVHRLCTTPATVLEGCADPGLTIGVLSRMQLCVSMRLHGLIFAAAAGIPFIGASYDIKVKGFMDYMGSDACRNIQEMETEWLCRQIDKIMADRTGSVRLCLHLQDLARCNPAVSARLMGKDAPATH